MSGPITLSSDELRLKFLVAEAVQEIINPWLTMDDMIARYHVKTSKTVTAMERRGEIPTRAKNGMWLRSEVSQWEIRLKMAA